MSNNFFKNPNIYFLLKPSQNNFKEKLNINKIMYDEIF